MDIKGILEIFFGICFFIVASSQQSPLNFFTAIVGLIVLANGVYILYKGR